MSNRWESPIARLRLDNNANDAYGTYNGSASNVTYGTTTPKEGSYYGTFNGSSSKVTINSLEATSLEFFTISFWVNGSASQAYKHFYSQGNSGNDQLYYRLLCSDGTGLCALEVKGAGGVLVSQWGNKTILDGTWHFVTLTDNSGTPTLYVDGVKDTGLTNTYTYEDISLNLTSIGVLSRTSDADFMAASFDDFRVYNVVLSQQEVKNLYDSYSTQHLWNYTSRWKFDSSGADAGPAGLTLTGQGTSRFGQGINSKCHHGDGSTNAWYTTTAHTALDFGTATNFSVAYWMKYNTGASGNSAILCNLNNPTYNAGYEVYPIGLTSTTLFIGPANRGLTYSKALVVDKWYHMVITADRATPALKLYINGKYDTQNTDLLNQNASSGSGTLTVAGEANPTTGAPRAWFNGYLDDVTVYGYLLSATDVKQLYNSYHGQYQLTQGTIV